MRQTRLTMFQAKMLIGVFLFILLTPIRSIAILVSPLFLYGIYCIHPFRVQAGMGWLIVIWGFTSFIGVLSGTTNWRNVMVSAIIFLPMLYLFFIMPQRNIRSLFTVNFGLFQRLVLYILIPVNIIGGIYWVKTGMIGDAWGIPYGSHYEAVHGLAMINIYICMYLGLRLFYEKRDAKTVSLFVFFLISIFGCQYGLGMICLFISILIYLLMMRRIKTVVLALMVLATGSWLLTLDSFRYEQENIMKAENRSDARKMEMFADFYDNVSHDMTLCVIGTGAGGYNSRSALLLSPDFSNPLKNILGTSTPPHFKKYIYRLWNDRLVSQSLFTDGTRNKPYSSMVSLWAEQGVFFFVFFCSLLWKNYRYLIKFKNRQDILYRYILLLDLFMIVSLITHLWLETSEFMMYALIRFACLAKLTYGKDSNYPIHSVLAQHIPPSQKSRPADLRNRDSTVFRLLDT